MAKLRRRDWIRPWNWTTRVWVGFILGCLLASPVLTRWFCLWQVPDVALPFDVTDMIKPDVPPDQDAFVGYATAMQLARRHMGPWSDRAIEDAIQIPNPAWDEKLDDWLVLNGKALAEFQRASEKEQASGPSLRTADIATLLPLHQDLRYLVRLGQAEAIRRERAGQLDEAWAMHRATLRCSVHAESPGIPICKLVGIAGRAQAFLGVVQWAEHSSLTAERLKIARAELKQIASLRMPVSDVSTAAYLIVRNSLNRPDVPNLVFPSWNASSSGQDPLLILKKFAMWSLGQPELTLRMARQLLLNNRNQIDKPLAQRRHSTKKLNELIFDLDPNEDRPWGQLDEQTLSNLFDSPFAQVVAKQVASLDAAHVDTAYRMDDGRLAIVDVVLACQQYHRTHQQFPETLDELTPTLLDRVPIDPMDPKGAPIKYRREAPDQAVVWSCGRDAVDDGGDVESATNGQKDSGYRIRARIQRD